MRHLPTVSFSTLVLEQIRLSKDAFGPGPRTKGLQEHVRKELREIDEDPYDAMEWIDVAILGMDGAWRAVRERAPWMTDEEIAEHVEAALMHKIDVNKEREWPDWRTKGQDEPIEHKKGSRIPDDSFGNGY